MITKKCKVCNTELPVDSGFYANDNTCKECRKAKVRANRAAKLEYYRQYDRDRANNPDRVEARKEYAKTPEGIASANKAKKKWSEKNKEIRSVHHAVNNAIRDGRLSKPKSCSNCGKTGCRIEGHHEDYSQPLSVTWLCSACHRETHKNGKENT